MTQDNNTKLYDTMNRRSMLKATGSAAAASTMVGQAAAQTNTTSTSTSTSTDTTTEDVYNIWRDNSTRIGGITSIMLGMTPAGIAAQSFTSTYDVAEYLYGVFDDLMGSDLSLSMYSMADQVRTNQESLIREYFDKVHLTENQILTEANKNIIDNINSESTRTTTTLNARNTAFELMAKIEESVISTIEGGLRRADQIDSREVTEGIADADRTISYNSDFTTGDSAARHNIDGVHEFRFELLDGREITTTALKIPNNGNPLFVSPLFHGGGDDTNAIIDRVNNTDLQEMNDLGSVSDELSGSAGNANFSAGYVSVEGYDGSNPGFSLFPNGTWFESEVPLSRNGGVYDNYGIRTPYAYFINHEIIKRANTFADEMQMYAGRIYDAVQAGEINTTDLISPYLYSEELAADWADTGHSGMAAAMLVQLGLSTNLNTLMDIEVTRTDASTSTYTDSLFVYGDASMPSTTTVEETWMSSPQTGWTYSTPKTISVAGIGDAGEVISNRNSYQLLWDDGTSLLTATEGTDYSITFDSANNAADVTVLSGGAIPEGNEMFLEVDYESSTQWSEASYAGVNWTYGSPVYLGHTATQMQHKVEGTPLQVYTKDGSGFAQQLDPANFSITDDTLTIESTASVSEGAEVFTSIEHNLREEVTMTVGEPWTLPDEGVVSYVIDSEGAYHELTGGDEVTITNATDIDGNSLSTVTFSDYNSQVKNGSGLQDRINRQKDAQSDTAAQGRGSTSTGDTGTDTGTDSGSTWGGDELFGLPVAGWIVGGIAALFGAAQITENVDKNQ